MARYPEFDSWRPKTAVFDRLAEAFRDDAGKARHRTPVTLGRLDQLSGSLDAVISGLLKAADQVINKNRHLFRVSLKEINSGHGPHGNGGGFMLFFE